MKRKIGLALLICMCCVALCACGDSKSQDTQQDQTDMEDQNTDKEVVEEKVPVLAVGDSSTTDTCEFTIDYVNITNDVMPPSPSSWYSHYEADEGKVYVDICVAYKNTATSDVDADEVISGTLLYADTYEYTGFSMIEEDDRSDFTYSNITSIAPLSTEYIHYLFEVPEEVESSGLSIALKMNIGGVDYQIIVRDGGKADSGDVKVQTPVQTGKSSGEVALNETIVTKNAEVCVDYSNITSDVMPPKPGNWYSHYEADSGKVYVDICFAYKNTSERNADADEVISAKMKYADKYDYTGFSMIEEDNRSDFTYSNITSIAPLSTEYIHYLFEVPEEVGSSSEPIVVTFVVDGNTYSYTVR